MKSEFLLAITQLSAEKNLPREVVLSAVESALASAYRKDNFSASQNVEVRIHPTTGKVEVWAEKVVVENATDDRKEIGIDKARKIKADVELDDTLMVESTPDNAGRIAAQTAKQVILQRLHEAEHSAIFEEYAGKEGDIVAGVVQRMEPRQILIDLGRVEAVLPSTEQMPNERYRIGQRLKVYLLEVIRTNKGPRVVVSRSHPDLLRRLFEMEVPEVFNGTVEIKSIAREAGYRSKVAVNAQQEGIDPVGCCVGLRGIRIQNIVNELNGEKIDVVNWDADVASFIASALSPAQIVHVELNQREGVATVIVPDKQLSLAIGKEGQNARLAAKLAGWRVDIKCSSDYEAAKLETEKEKAAQAVEEVTEVEEKLTVEETVEPVIAQPVEDELIKPEVLEELVEEVTVEEKAEEEVTDDSELESVETLKPIEEITEIKFEPEKVIPDSGLRFAEDILGPRPVRGESKSRKKKKKSSQGKTREEDDLKVKRVRKQEISVSEEDEF